MNFTTHKRARCTFCNQVGWVPRKDNICSECDKQLKAESLEFERTQKMSHRKCRSCKGPLPVTRYFDCDFCVKALPSDDTDFLYWEDCDDDAAAAPKRVPVFEKTCTRCKSTRASHEFSKDKNSKDGLMYTCKPCGSELWRERKKRERGFIILEESANELPEVSQ